MLVRADAFSEPTDVTPPGFNVRTTVHEYGGGAYLLHDGAVTSERGTREAGLQPAPRAGEGAQPPRRRQARSRR